MDSKKKSKLLGTKTFENVLLNILCEGPCRLTKGIGIHSIALAKKDLSILDICALQTSCEFLCRQQAFSVDCSVAVTWRGRKANGTF